MMMAAAMAIMTAHAPIPKVSSSQWLGNPTRSMGVFALFQLDKHVQILTIDVWRQPQQVRSI